MVITGDWAQVHQSINRAFTETTVDHTPVSDYLFLIGLAFFLLVLLTCIYWLKTHNKRTVSVSTSFNPTPGYYNGNGTWRRRNWVRVPAGLDLLYAPAETGEVEKNPESRKVRIHDISGGGLLFKSPDKLEINQVLKMVLTLSPDRQFQLTGRVARVIETSTDGPGFLVGVEFVELSNGIRDQITKWVFARQQKLILRKKRMAEGTCLRCGKPLPGEIKDDLAYCPHCLTYAQPDIEQD